ncbi:MAG: hypothetical protein EOM72_10025 [Opitutae bacterium]|nr:hypothetical protein [Opitutae bacterium]
MNKKSRWATAELGLAFLGLFLSSRASADFYSSAQDGSWHESSTWSNAVPAGGGIPGAGDTATLRHAVDATQSVDLAALNIDSGRLSSPTGSVFLMRGTGIWHAATIQGGGEFRNEGRLIVTGAPSTLAIGTFRNEGETEFVQTPSLDLNGQFLNTTQGVVQFHAPTGMSMVVGGTGALHNAGNLVLGWGTTCSWPQARFHNSGHVALTTDAYFRAQSGGTWSNASLGLKTGAVFHLAGGTNSVQGGLQAQGAGKMWMTTGQMTFVRSGTITGTYLNAQGGGFHWQGGTISASVPNGELYNQGQMYIAGTTQLLQGTLINQGSMSFFKGTTDGVFQVAGGLISNAPSGTISFEGTGGRVQGSGSQLHNSGTVQFSAEGTTSVGMVYFQHGGTSTFSRSVVELYGQMYGGWFLLAGGRWQGGQSFYVSGGGVGGSGQVANNLHQESGRLSPGSSPGKMEIDGTFLQTGAEPELFMEIGGLVAGDDYDQIAVSSTGTVSGVLTVELLDGYEPPAAARFDLLLAAERTGRFAETNLPALEGGRFWVVRYREDGIQLRVATPEDTDGDGLRDEWERDRLGSLDDSDGGADDFDEDGYSDHVEMICDTDPKDPGDHLSIGRIESDGEREWIRMHTASNVPYAVEAREDLSDAHAWAPVDVFVGVGGEQVWTNAPGGQRGILRVRLAP